MTMTKPSPNYHSDLCSYSAMYPDNVAFHYVEFNGMKMSYDEAKKKLKR